MRTAPCAGLIALATLGAHAQVPLTVRIPDPVVITATRALSAEPTLRDTTVITRDEIEASGALSLGEVLERRAGVELRSNGGPGQTQGIFIRGAGAAQTLVLVDGMRVGSATQGTTAIENIPLEMIERIEVVKGAMSSLYGSEAAGGVVQVFTRGRSVPHLFASGGLGTDRDRRLSGGFSTVEKDTQLNFSIGGRKVEADSATNLRAGFFANTDTDPYENAFATLRIAQKMWQGETVVLETFGSRGRTRFDAGGDSLDDHSDQTIFGARLSSAISFTSWWASKLAIGTGRDKLEFSGLIGSRIETRQDQASWINEFSIPGGTLLAGLETVRQQVRGDESVTYAVNERDTNSGFLSLTQAWGGERIEGSIRRDEDDQFGSRDTGSASYGTALGWARLSGTIAKGFRAPTFNDLYAVFGGDTTFYRPNPDLKPERSDGWEVALRSNAGAARQWRITAFDNRFEDLIVFSPGLGMPINVDRARIKGVEATYDGTWYGVRLRASATFQRPRNEETGARLQGRAERFGSVEASRRFGAITASVLVHASGDRFDSVDEAPESRLPGYATVDVRVRYAFEKFWKVELTATNLFDKRYESSVGFDAPRRGVFLNVRFDAF